MNIAHGQPAAATGCLPPALRTPTSRRPAPAHTAAALGYPRLVADIGGTNARFGIIDSADSSPQHVRKLAVDDYGDPGQAARAYLDQLACSGVRMGRPCAAAIAIATPIVSDRIEMTNCRWGFSRAALQADLGLEALVVLNDFEALALSLPKLTAAQLRADGQRQGAGNTMAVVGPGTGLGVAGVVRTRSGWVALPGEGGHATLAPIDDFESAVLAAVRIELPHVSAERLLSGIGLPTLYRAVAAVSGRAPEAMSAEQIVTCGTPGDDALCATTLDVFCALLGNFAGNVALTFGARGGVYIGGGIVPRLGDRFFASRFRERFEAKGRFHHYLAQIPTCVITDTLVALTGAAVALDQYCPDTNAVNP